MICTILTLEFASAYFTLGDTSIQQLEGIGIGPPSSPALALLATKWIRSGMVTTIPIAPVTQYMDDVITVYPAGTINPTSALIASFKAHKMNLLVTDEEVRSCQYLQYLVQVQLENVPRIIYGPKPRLRYYLYDPQIPKGTYHQVGSGTTLCHI